MIKNILIFLSGMLTMFVITAVFAFIQNTQAVLPSGLTVFEQPGSCINSKQIKIFQTLEQNMALAHALTKPNEIFDENRTLVLILGDENTHYYDDQKIDIPKGLCAKQIGTYKYKTKEDLYKTVPAVEIK